MDELSQSALLRARYGREAAWPEVPGNPVITELLRHRSVRAFKPDPIAPGTLELLIAAAQSAPTSSNLQAWSVVAVADPARRERLSRLADNQGFIRQAPLFLAWIADLSRLDRLGQAHARRLEGTEFLELFMVALVDAALAAQNALVAAESLGLGTVYVGALRNHPDQVAAELGLPPNAFAAFGLSVGHPDPAVASATKPRLPQELVLHREQYGTGGELAAIEAYDRRLQDFSEANGMGRVGWIGRMLNRVGAVKDLRGRDQMREMLSRLGFGLR